MESQCPRAVIVMCGKRKSGKDYVASQLQLMCVVSPAMGSVCKLCCACRLGEELVCPVRLSAPLKSQYAKVIGNPDL